MHRHRIILKPSAKRDMDALRRYDAARIADALEKLLAVEPTRESRSRIKRLRGIAEPDYRLRVGEFRVFYSVDESEHRVDVLRVMHKDQTRDYYEELQ